MSLPISLPFTVAYSLVTALSLRNELRAESRAPSAGGPPNDQDTGIVRRTLNSPGVVCAFTSAVALTQGIYLLASGEPVLGGAYIATGIGNGALANLSNRQLGYSILEEKESRIGRVWRSIVRGTPKKLKTALSNPVVGFAVANTLFSFSTLEPDPSSAQLTAMSIGIGFGLVAAIRGMMRDSRALTTSLILGGLSVAGHAGNAIIGGAGVTAAALALWSAQHFSSYTRERERETQ
ncbi:MAG: hypothetical protein KDD70_16730 [Bdellovibrionales bacterium]|nr:hypothetical protein [Bdellovibrionales bacterium]